MLVISYIAYLTSIFFVVHRLFLRKNQLYNWVQRIFAFPFALTAKKIFQKQLQMAGLGFDSTRPLIRKQILFSILGGGSGFFLWTFGVPFWFAPTLALLGFLMPLHRVHRKGVKRKHRIERALPYYLDLLILTMDAGLDLVSSMEEIISIDKDSALSDEFQITLNAIRLGTPRSLAFGQFAERTQLKSATFLAAAIEQSEELGSPLNHSLRFQAAILRDNLSQSAEENAQKAPVKLLLPLVVFIFPVLFIILLFPIFMQLSASL